MNIQNRKSQVNLKELKLLWEKYELKSNELNLMRRKLNELNAQTKKLAVSGEKLSNFILKDKSKHQSNIEERQKELEEIESNMIEEAFHIPNSTSPQSPVGIENKEIYSSTEETLEQLCKKFEKHIHHTDLIEKKDLCDFENGSKLSGSKFLFLKSKLVYLELGLVMYALEKLEKKGFTIVSSPEIVKNEIITGCGFTPRDKSKNQIYSIKDDETGLIGTSEITLMGIATDEILKKEQLPLKLASWSHCFRREAGRGEKSKGLYRLHQFTKVEMFSFTEGDLKKSEQAQFEMLEIEKEIYNELGLIYKVYEMSTEELGSSAYRKFDIEAFFPSLQGYGEISSCSNCTDYQSSRLLAQYWDLENKKQTKKLLHTVNGTAIAVPRIIMAILENHQNENGEVVIPECLRKYLNFDKI